MRSALNALAIVHDDRNRLLFAAVSEAIHHGSKAQAAQHLQRLLDRYRNGLPPEVDGCALLRSVCTVLAIDYVDNPRCTARLLLSAIDEAEDAPQEHMSRLCGVFKSGGSVVVFNNRLLNPLSLVAIFNPDGYQP